MLTGAMFIRIFQKYNVTNHQIIFFGTIMIVLFSWLFSISRVDFWLGLWIFLASIGYSVYEIIINVCLLMISPAKEVEYWMLLAHGSFGVGGLLSPIIVYLF